MKSDRFRECPYCGMQLLYRCPSSECQWKRCLYCKKSICQKEICDEEHNIFLDGFKVMLGLMDKKDYENKWSSLIDEESIHRSEVQ